MRVFVVGEAGYIGSHKMKHVGEAGIDITTLENFSFGQRGVVAHGNLVEGDLGDCPLLDELLRARNIKDVMHFAAHIEVGEPQQEQIRESYTEHPIAPYGISKLMVEQIIGDYDMAYGLKSICLRYLNVASADPGGAIGERHELESHLVPLVLSAASGRRENGTVFGPD